MLRILQVIKYGWLHASKIVKADSTIPNWKVIDVFIDIISCYCRYRMWSNQYLEANFYNRPKGERYSIGKIYRSMGIKRDNWQKDFRATRKFLNKYTGIRYEISHLREKRKRAYTKYYGIGTGLHVEYDVNLSRQHYLEGNLKIGNNVLLAKHVFIDYSGDLIRDIQ